MKKSLEERIAEVIKEDTAVVEHSSCWVEMFEAEKKHLLGILPSNFINRIEHFGSTAVVGLPAKPIVDMLIEVTSLEETKKVVVPVLEGLGYDYFWRPDGQPGGYAWFIKRNKAKKRTHHLHFVEKDSPLWERLFFRDYLRLFPAVAKEYADLKKELCAKFPNDRIAYHNSKTEFVLSVTQRAIKYFNKKFLA